MRSVLLAMILGALLPAGAALADGDAPVPPISDLPSMNFGSTIAGEEIFTVLKNEPVFASLAKEQYGSPLLIRVSHLYGHTAAGTASNLANAVFVGATLGLLPAVSNRDLVVKYDVLVNGSTLLSYSYSRNLTRVFNIHSTDKTYGLGDDGLAWVKDTARQFAQALGHDTRFVALRAEYTSYFGAPAVAAQRP